MLYRKTALRIAAPVAVLALALTACGGGDDKKDSADKPKAGANEPKAKPSPESGGELGTGESATGKVKEGNAPVTYEITAQKVDLGTEADTKKMVADPKDAKGLIPAIAHVKYTHKSGAALTETPDANDSTTVWAGGRRGTLVIGAAEDAPGCDDSSSIEGWKQGESHVLCETYLVPKDAKDLEIHWSEEDGEPFIWKFAAG
ncbi:hypothetical protein OG302_08315 [Streptomyces sp. NBC_01283]|uniref:hypothetical protein n=1 Tax=Streptomyces sp. NBC_01283 TaxID=2903812 RepID=UPI00352C12F7|nr:hypothetical protein OG302_08315 [Streptomyces sp. NBC_01283]